MYTFIIPLDLMYRGHIVKASSVSRKKMGRQVSVAQVPLVGKGLKTEQ